MKENISLNTKANKFSNDKEESQQASLQNYGLIIVNTEKNSI